MRLYEKYRPNSLDRIIGNHKAIQTAQRLIKTGLGGRSFWISGASGIGKTSLARIMARSIADDLYVQEFDCADQLTTAVLDKIETDMQYKGFNSGKVSIINESHGMKKSAIRRLLGILEKLPDYCIFVFTTTRQGQEKLFEDNIDASPLLSRCIRIDLTSQGLCKVFAKKAREIACKEGLNGRPIESYIRLAQDCKNNLRAMINKIESGNMLGSTP